MPQTKLETLRQQSNLLMAKVQSLKKSQQDLEKMSDRSSKSASRKKPVQKSEAVTPKDASGKKKGG